MTFFNDLKGHRIIHIAESKGKESLVSLVRAVEGGLGPNRVRLVCMEMQLSFIAGCEETLPNAIIVFDHFHVIKLLNGAIDRIRIEESRENDLLKRTKFLWLTNPENLEEWQERKFLQVKDLDTKTAKAYHIKLAIQRTCSCRRIWPGDT